MKKSDKALSLIYAEHEGAIEKIGGCKIILKNYMQQKQVRIFYHVFSMSTISSLKSTENKYDVYIGKGYINKFLNL